MSRQTEPTKRQTDRKAAEGFAPIRAPAVAAALAVRKSGDRAAARREPPPILRDAAFES